MEKTLAPPSPLDAAFDFAALAQGDTSVTVHNVRLIDVRQAEGGRELLIIERAGITCELLGAGRWSQEHSRHNVGKLGYIKSDGACCFRNYIDQSLRRVPELDGDNWCPSTADLPPWLTFNQMVVGWRCDARPSGFRAPVGIIPGEAGRFVPDDTLAVTLYVPPEFERECQRVQMTPEQLLRSFVGDLAGIQDLAACPRADRYGSNGSDERELANAWLQRAHGMNAFDLGALEARAAEEEERQFQRDDFADLLHQFEAYGGKADDLFNAVQALVDKQAEAEAD